MKGDKVVNFIIDGENLNKQHGREERESTPSKRRMANREKGKGSESVVSVCRD